MSEMKKIKIEPVCDDNDRTKSVDCIENNINKEPEVEFVLILPLRQVKVEKVEEEKVHSETQSNEKKFQCQQCPKSFEKRKNLYMHERSHSRKVKCYICSKEVKRTRLKVHLKRHETIDKFKCDHGSAGFVTKSELTQHMKIHRSDKKFNCAQCQRGYNSGYNFKVHLLSHSTNPRPFQCDLCPKSYPTKHELGNHLTAIHSNQQSFKCDECDFTTKWQDYLYKHKQRHSSAKPFSCQICEKKFKSKYEVQSHQAVHKKTNDFECKTCEKMFGRLVHLRRHQIEVHGKDFKLFVSNLVADKNFTCSKCPKTFRSKLSNLLKTIQDKKFEDALQQIRMRQETEPKFITLYLILLKNLTQT
jgi:KRAB domain-containing zinc finger protein